LTEIKRDLLKEFKNPKSESQCIKEFKEIKKIARESMWDYDQWFNILLERLQFQLQDVQHQECFVFLIPPHIQLSLTQKKVTTQAEVVEIAMWLVATLGGGETSI
jgi:hypothetical protein